MNNLKNKLIENEKLKNKIIDLYINKDLKKDEVAKELNLSLWTLSNLFKAFNIQKNKNAILNKRKQTCLEKYGTDNPSKSIQVKEIISEKNKLNSKSIVEKSKLTKLEKYGDSNYNNSSKNKETKLLKYGSENFNNRSKYKTTMLEKFGVDNGFKLKETIETNLNNLLNSKNYSTQFKELFSNRDLSINFLKDKNYSYFDLMNLFNAPYYVIQVWVTRLELKDYINYKYEGKSHYEDELNLFINNLGFETIRHDRKILKGQELDIFIPEKNVAIEFDNDYSHNNELLDKHYHFNKSYLCEKQNIRLIHIYEYQWQDPIKQNILKSIIKNSLGVNDNILYARKCEIKELSKKDVFEFSNLNSLHGHRNASIYLGLFYNNELVQIMTFGKAFFSKDNSIDYECIRSITKINTTVIGGMNKLFKYFINKWNPNKILYYVDYNTHIGNSMNKLEFEFINYSKGGIVNISNSKETIEKYGYVFNRKPQYHKEIQEYIKQGKIFSIYDAGVKKYIWTRK